MKLKDYIVNVLFAINDTDTEKVEFDIGVGACMEVDEMSKNRVKFTCIRKRERENGT